ncbi:DNA-binding protein [Variovorax gossypii]
MEMESSRGITQAQVWAAADEILIEGQRPTIERIRQRLGRGSPNTVGPMVERWFATLGKRLEGRGAASNDDAGQQVPLPILRAATQLWQAARTEADQALRQESEAGKRQLELEQAELQQTAVALRTREEAFESNRSQLEAALASSQHAVATMREQLEAANDRSAAADQLAAKLRRQLEEAGAQRERLKEEHAAAIVARERLAHELDDRYVANERRLLHEVDRAREDAKQAVLIGTRERAARGQLEQQLAEQREKLTEELRAARAAAAQVKVDADLRVTEHAGVLAQVRGELEGARGRLHEAQALHEREMTAHEATRQLLKQAMAAPSDRAEAIPAPPPGRTRGPRKRDTD